MNRTVLLALGIFGVVSLGLAQTAKLNALKTGAEDIKRIEDAFEVVREAKQKIVIMTPSIYSKTLMTVLIERAKALRSAKNPYPIKIVLNYSKANQQNAILIRLAQTPGIAIRGQKNIKATAAYLDGMTAVVSLKLAGLQNPNNVPEKYIWNTPAYVGRTSAMIEKYFPQVPQLWRLK